MAAGGELWEVAVRECASCAHIVDDLAEEVGFRFRVRAVNICGASEGGAPSQEVRALAGDQLQHSAAAAGDLWLTSVLWQTPAEFARAYRVVRTLWRGRYTIYSILDSTYILVHC